jgi:hypothetical protein
MTIAFDLIAAAKTYAATTLAGSIGAMGMAASALNSIKEAPQAAAPSYTVGVPTPTTVGAAPQYTGQRFAPPPNPREMDALQTVPTLTMPTSPGAAPGILSYDAPAAPAGEPDPNQTIGAPPTPLELKVPDPKDLLAASNVIVKPDLDKIVVTAAPEYKEPPWDGHRPADPPAPRTDLDSVMRTQYQTISPIMKTAVKQEIDDYLNREFPQHRTNMAAINDRLARYLAGGTALTPAVENAIYARAVDKTNADSRRAAKAAWERAAQMGHTVPGAILLAQQQDLAQEARNANVRAAIDIAVRQAELEQSNLQFAVTQSNNLIQIAISGATAYYNGLVTINGQALEYARDVVDDIIKSYEITARFAELQARVYEADTRVYEAKLRGALAVIEAYTAKVKGWEAQATVNIAKVTVYKAQIDALQAEATVYRAAIDGVSAQAVVERNKVELYQARVSAYGAQINAYTARWQGFEAAVRGQAAKMQASAEKVRAYSAEVGAYEAVVRAKAVEIDSVVRSNEGKVRAYAAGVDAYSALVRGSSEAVKAEIESFSVGLQSYVAKADADAKHSMAEIASYEAGFRSVLAAASLHLQNLVENNKVMIARAEGLARVAVSAGEVWSAQAQAALSGANVLGAEIVSATA